MQILVLVQAVVGTAEGHAGAAARQQAGVDGVEALEEAVGPGRIARLVGDRVGVGRRVVQALHPVVHISLLRTLALLHGRLLLVALLLMRVLLLRWGSEVVVLIHGERCQRESIIDRRNMGVSQSVGQRRQENRTVSVRCGSSELLYIPKERGTFRLHGELAPGSKT